MSAVLCIVNRVLLALIGLGVAALGTAVLLAGLDLPRPGFTPFEGPGDVLLSRDQRMRWRGEGWWWPTVVGALSVLLLCSLWWLGAQLRRHRLGEILIDPGRVRPGSAGDAGGAERADGPVALLRGRALEDVLAEETGALDGVARTHVTLTGRRSAPRARFGVLLGPGAQPAATVAHIEGETLGQARKSTGLARLPAEVRMGTSKHRAERVT